MITRTKSRAAAERISNNGSSDLLADLHLVVEDALKHGEIHKASVYCDALMRVALGESPGYIPERISCEKSITYRNSVRAKCIAHFPRVLMALAVAILFVNHLEVAPFISNYLMDRGLIGPAMCVVNSELAIEQLFNSTESSTLAAKVDMLSCDARFEEAMRLADATMAQYPDDGRLATNKLISLQLSGRYEEVIAAADESRQSVSAFYRDTLELNAAEAYTHLNNLSKAETSWNAVTDKDLLQSPYAKTVLARIEYMQGDSEGARRLLRESLSRRGLRRAFNSDYLTWAHAALLQADILQSAGNESRANRLRARAEALLAKHHLAKLPDILLQN